MPQYIDRFELEVPLIDVEPILEQWDGLPEGSGATRAVPLAPGLAKVEIWGKAAQDAFYWWHARKENPQWRVMRIDVCCQLPAGYTTGDDLWAAARSLKADQKVRARIGVQEQDRQGEKGTTQLTVGSPHSAKHWTIYGREEGWRVEARLRQEQARHVAELLSESDAPLSMAKAIIERVQFDLMKEVLFPLGERLVDITLPRKSQERRPYTPAEQMRRARNRMLSLAGQHGLWDELAATIPEIFAVLHQRAMMVEEWEQGTLDDALLRLEVSDPGPHPA